MSGITLTEVDDATISTPASGKATIFLDDTIGPAYKDDTGTVTSLEGADGDAELTYTNHGNTGSGEALDWSVNVHRVVLDASCTFTFSNVPASGTPGIIEVIIVQDGTGGRTATWPAAVTWGVAGAPVLQVAANAVDVVHFQSVDGGTTVYGSVPSRSGPAGGAISIDYTISSTTTDADPGSGLMRLDNFGTQTSATKIRVDLVDRLGTTQTAVIDSLDDSTNTVKGHIRLFKSDDPSKWLVFTISAVDSSSGYRNITVSNVAGSASSPFVAGDPITLAFTRAGNVGATGAGGASTRATVGTTSAGASFTTARGAYIKKITLASDRYVMSIHAFVKGNAAQTAAMSVFMLSDSSGTPVSVIVPPGAIQKEADNTSVTNLGMSATVRDSSVGVGRYLTAGDYWIGVIFHAAADSRISLAYNSGSGSDRYANTYVATDESFVSYGSSTTHDYCIYADTLVL